jgi:hypothetical protein
MEDLGVHILEPMICFLGTSHAYSNMDPTIIEFAETVYEFRNGDLRFVFKDDGDPLEMREGGEVIPCTVEFIGPGDFEVS